MSYCFYHLCHKIQYFIILFFPSNFTTLGFPCGSAGKESVCNAGNLGSIPGLGRSPGEGKGYPLQYSSLENSMESIGHGVSKSRTQLSSLPFHCFGRKNMVCKPGLVLSLNPSLSVNGDSFVFICQLLAGLDFTSTVQPSKYSLGFLPGDVQNLITFLTLTLSLSFLTLISTGASSFPKALFQHRNKSRISSKESACQGQRWGFNPRVGKIPWRRKWRSSTIFLPGESNGQRSLAGMGSQKNQTQLSD